MSDRSDKTGEARGWPEAEGLLSVGFVHRAHGVRGEMRVRSLCPEALDFAELVNEREVWLRRGAEPLASLRVLSLRGHQDDFLLTAEGIEDREAAEALRGAELCMERSELPDLPEGWFWEEDLVGLEVIDRRLGKIGAVTGLENVGAQWQLRIKTEGGKSIDIPWATALVPKVDLDSRRVEVDLPDDYPGLS